MTKKSLTAEQLAAIASGAVIEASAVQETAEITAEDAATAAAAAAETAKQGDPAATAEATATAAQAAATAAEATAAAGAAGQAAVQAESALVTFLRSELATAQATILANGIKLAGLEASAQQTKDTMPKLLEIARVAVDRMKIAMGGSSGAAATMTPLEVIAAHAEASAAFTTKFKVGGAAATSASVEKPAAVKSPSPPNLHVITARNAVR